MLVASDLIGNHFKCIREKLRIGIFRLTASKHCLGVGILHDGGINHFPMIILSMFPTFSPDSRQELFQASTKLSVVAWSLV